MVSHGCRHLQHAPITATRFVYATYTVTPWGRSEMNSTLPSGDFPMTSFVPPPLPSSPGALITHSTAKPALLGAACGEGWLVSAG